MQVVLKAGGTLSGEHGIGNDKMEYLGLVFGPRELALQKALIHLFNPLDQLNPGKVFEGRHFVAKPMSLFDPFYERHGPERLAVPASQSIAEA